jgi:phenylacetate-CoA ligase
MSKYFNQDIETASREYLHAIQSARLIKMVYNCYNNVPFYKDKFDQAGIAPQDIKSIDDIVNLPFTVKQDLRDNYPFGLFAVPKEKLVRIHASSGTTGKQTVVGYTQGDVERWSEGSARALVAAGGTESDYIHVSYGYGLFTGGLGLHYGAEMVGATVIPVSSGNTSRQVQILQDFGSNIICCTPSYAMFIGETIKEMGINPDDLPLRAGIFGAEPWSESMRKEIEKSLSIKAYDIYGLSEIAGPGVAYECCAQNGMHICEDFFYPEVVDPDTLLPVPDGTFGELVFTCIGKRSVAARALSHKGHFRPHARNLFVRAYPCKDAQTARPFGRYADNTRGKCLPVTSRACHPLAGHGTELSNRRRPCQQSGCYDREH